MQNKPRKEKPGASMVLRTYWRYLKKYPFHLAVMITTAFTLQAAFLVAPLYLRQLFNILVSHTPDIETVHTLIIILSIVTLTWFAEWLSRRFQGFSLTYMTSKVMTVLQSDAFSYLLGHSNSFFTNNFAGSLTHKVKRFSSSFEVIFDGILLQFLPTFLFVVGAVVILFTRNHTLGIALGVWSIAFIAFQLYVARIRQPLRVKRAEADTEVTAVLADAVSNHTTIALFSAEEYERKTFHETIERWREATTRLWRTDEWIWAGIGLFIMVIEAGLMFGGIYFWERGQITIGDFVLIQSYLLTTFDRLVGINRELRSFYTALAEAGEMLDILQLPHEVKDIRGAKKLIVSKGEIEFNDIGFFFHTDRGIVKDFSLKIEGSQKVALVGPSGAGKSTLTKLLLRLFDLKSGTITIDGQNIAKVTQDSLRKAISFVPQEPVLFHRTLMENIRYGRRDATDEEVIEAAKKAHCHEFISQLPETYNTFVGERGIKLSGGERQRVAIARAILKDSPILVLDEATSSLDSESEALIQDALEKVMQPARTTEGVQSSGGKTVIVIAHRLSTIMKMDRIVVLEDGKIVADGTHDELLQRGGLYQKLWSIQAGGFIGLPDETNKGSLDDDVEAEADPIESDES